MSSHFLGDKEIFLIDFNLIFSFQIPPNLWKIMNQFGACTMNRKFLYIWTYIDTESILYHIQLGTEDMKTFTLNHRNGFEIFSKPSVRNQKAEAGVSIVPSVTFSGSQPGIRIFRHLHCTPPYWGSLTDLQIINKTFTMIVFYLNKRFLQLISVLRSLEVNSLLESTVCSTRRLKSWHPDN